MPPRSLSSLPPEVALAAARRSRIRARPWWEVVLRRVIDRWRGLAGRLMAGSAASTGPTAASGATLPEDKAEAIFHVYDGGGVKATGPALLVRKSLFDRVSLSAQYYVDAVSNASIDVVTTASPFKEKRTAYDFSAETVVRDSTLSVSLSRSTEPDYTADAIGFDVAHEVFGGMSTVSMGFTRASDQVGKKGVVGWIDKARHWQYRAGLTQILSPRWLVSANAEVISDDGYLGSPYRVARVFGAAVPERNPRTRTGRAVKFRSITDTGAWVERSSFRAEYRTYWDTWDIKAQTFGSVAASTWGRASCSTRLCARTRRPRRCSTATTRSQRRSTSRATARLRPA